MIRNDGPVTPAAQRLHAMKYRGKDESFRMAMTRIADALKDDSVHFHEFRDMLLDQRFLPAGRIQAAVGAARRVTAFNCFVSGTIPDSMDGIMDMLKEAASTLRMGGGIGYDFSSLRPLNDLIASLQSTSSGPVSFMGVYDALCRTIHSSGHRRGAQMGVLRIDHPDILEFIRAKHNTSQLTYFNVSVGVTDEFMAALSADADFDLRFGGRRYATVKATALWDELMRSTWDWSEPGVLFIDTINKQNNLRYCEEIAATNPCGEVPLPPYGACLLGSFNLVKYLYKQPTGQWTFEWKQFREDIPVAVRALDNVIDRTTYPLRTQEVEARRKRRIGLGVTGVANALEAMGLDYGNNGFRGSLAFIMETLRDEAYAASIRRAEELGAFPLYKEDYLESPFVRALPPGMQKEIAQHGIRNSHLISIAPAGTISQCADNVSSGIEPVFGHQTERLINTPDGQVKEELQDYGFRHFGVLGRTADECSVGEHLGALMACVPFVDQGISKTCNVGSAVSWEEFKNVYRQAYRGGAKGVTTFRKDGKRPGIIEVKADKEEAPVCSMEDGCPTC